MFDELTLGERIKLARQHRGMTQKELGEKTYISKDAISYYERDMSEPSFRAVIDISKALNVKLDWFVEAFNKVDVE